MIPSQDTVYHHESECIILARPYTGKECHYQSKALECLMHISSVKNSIDTVGVTYNPHAAKSFVSCPVAYKFLDEYVNDLNLDVSHDDVPFVTYCVNFSARIERIA